MDAHKSLKKWSEFDKCSFWSLFSEMKITCMAIACFIFWVFTVMPSFSVLMLWHTFAHCHPNSGSKTTQYRLKNVYILLKSVLLKLSFQDEGHLYGNCFIFSPFAWDSFFFIFSVVAYVCTSPSYPMLQNDTLAAKNCHNLQIKILLKLNLQHEGHLFSNYLFYILTTFRKCLLFQFSGCGFLFQFSGFAKKVVSFW